MRIVIAAVGRMKQGPERELVADCFVLVASPSLSDEVSLEEVLLADADELPPSSAA